MGLWERDSLGHSQRIVDVAPLVLCPDELQPDGAPWHVGGLERLLRHDPHVALPRHVQPRSVTEDLVRVHRAERRRKKLGLIGLENIKKGKLQSCKKQKGMCRTSYHHMRFEISWS